MTFKTIISNTLPGEEDTENTGTLKTLTSLNCDDLHLKTSNWHNKLSGEHFSRFSFKKINLLFLSFIEFISSQAALWRPLLDERSAASQQRLKLSSPPPHSPSSSSPWTPGCPPGGCRRAGPSSGRWRASLSWSSAGSSWRSEPSPLSAGRETLYTHCPPWWEVELHQAHLRSLWLLSMFTHFRFITEDYSIF